MKANICLVALSTFLLNTAIAQEVIIKGTLRCANNGVATSTKGAINIIIIPSFNPKASVATTTNPEGFFQINTGWNAENLKDKDVTLYIITKCSSCKKIQRVFISEDLDKRNTDPTKMYVTVKNWKLLDACDKTELPDLMSEKLLDSAHLLPAQDITGKAPGSPALAPVSFINLFQKLATAAATANFGLFKVTAIQPGKIKYGIFLHSSPMTNTDNTGFNFAPSRNLSEAVFWNAAAIANSSKPYNISLLANFKNNIKLSGYQQITKQFFLGLGGIYTKQGESRQLQVIGIGASNSGSIIDGVNHQEKLEEFAAFLAPVYKINNRLSAGVTIKSIWQQFNNPKLVSMEQDGSDNTAYNFFQDDSIRKQDFDVDVSLSYKITNFLQAGVSVMNIAGTKLYADQFVADSANQSYINQRAYGVGLCYKRGRLNVGADVLLTDKEFYDASLGVNYVPFNNAVIAAGYAFKQQSFSVSFRLKHFKIAYINDNNLVINDVKVSKSKIFNGKIYSGFVFDF
ncbi:MAG TPA: hypothetical protein VN726_13495 [Hanamia sp.]|nr:hypothetical protein [Hanamia sp.]